MIQPPQARSDGPCPQTVIALDLEGVLTPEIWPSVGADLGIAGLQRTTRHTGDYGALLRERLAVVADAGLGLGDVLAVVERLEPLPGALDLLDHLRARWPVVVLSDTFEQLADPLLAKLGRPFTLCHRLRVHDGRILGAEVRRAEAKADAVAAFQGLGYRVIAAGDSHNDLSMLRRADHGCLLRPPPSLLDVGLPVVRDLTQLAAWIDSVADDEPTTSSSASRRREGGQGGRRHGDDGRDPTAQADGSVDVVDGRGWSVAQPTPILDP